MTQINQSIYFKISQEEFLNKENTTPIKSTNYFKNKEPNRFFRFFVSFKRKICIDYSKSGTINKIEGLIYLIKNEFTGKVYVGKTSGTLKQRMGNYLAAINRAARMRAAVKKSSSSALKNMAQTSRSSFIREIATHPTRFSVGILHILKPGENIDVIEDLFIRAKRESSPLYNSVGGGGGGLSHRKEIPLQFFLPNKITPKKYYPFTSDAGGHIRPELTPSVKKCLFSRTDASPPRTLNFDEHDEPEAQPHEDARKRERDSDTTRVPIDPPPISIPTLYVIKDTETEQRYVGVTNDPRRRAFEHGRAAALASLSPNTAAVSKLHSAMAKTPERFQFGVFPMERAYEDFAPMSSGEIIDGSAALEKALIALKLSYDEGFNGNRGGGGPIGRNEIFSL